MQMKIGHVMREVGLERRYLRGSGLWFLFLGDEWDDAKPVILPGGRSGLAPTRHPARTSRRLPWRPTAAWAASCRSAGWRANNNSAGNRIRE